MAIALGLATTFAVIAAVAVLFFYAHTRKATSSGIVRLSHLKCRRCGAEFDYAWIPGASLTSVRLGGSRYFRCPACGKFSLFNIWDTQVDPEKHHCSIKIGPS